MGPNASTPEAFTEMLSQNTGTWATIDRDNLDHALPIWELIKDEPEEGNMHRRPYNSFTAVNPERGQILKAIRLMKRVWKRRAEDLGLNPPLHPYFRPLLFIPSKMRSLRRPLFMIW
jgi:hypothetical protein